MFNNLRCNGFVCFVDIVGIVDQSPHRFAFNYHVKFDIFLFIYYHFSNILISISVCSLYFGVLVLKINECGKLYILNT